MCRLASPHPRTYIGSGKAAEIKTAIRALDVETVIFDDELSPGSVYHIREDFFVSLFCCYLIKLEKPHFDFRQLRNLEKAFGEDVRVCDRTALILDIFNQRAATHEAALQAILSLYFSLLCFS